MEFLLQKYSLISKVQQGTFGQVSKVQKDATGKYYAVKQITTNINESDWNEFIPEVTVLRTLMNVHQHLMRLHEVIMDIEPFLVLEYYPEDLFDCKNALSFAEKLRYFAQIVTAVHCLHSLGIAHRDIKLENILIDRERKTIALTDFGACQLFVSWKYPKWKLQESRNSVGSPGYMAPEACVEGPPRGLSLDIWSLGSSLFSLLTNRRLVNQEEDVNHYTEKAFEEYWMDRLRPFIKVDLQPRCFELFKGMLQRDPSKRWSTKKILEHPLMAMYLYANVHVENVRWTALPKPGFLSFQKEIREETRYRLLDRLLGVIHQKKMHPNCLCLAARIMDSYCSNVELMQEHYPLLGAVALQFASFLMTIGVELQDEEVANFSHTTVDKVRKLQMCVLNVLQYRLLHQSVFALVEALCKKQQLPEKIYRKAQSYALWTVYDSYFSSKCSNEVAYACVFLAYFEFTGSNRLQFQLNFSVTKLFPSRRSLVPNFDSLFSREL